MKNFFITFSKVTLILLILAILISQKATIAAAIIETLAGFWNNYWQIILGFLIAIVIMLVSAAIIILKDSRKIRIVKRKNSVKND